MPFTAPNTRDGLRALAREAHDHGIQAKVRYHRTIGWSLWTRTPFHDLPVRVMDMYDVFYLRAELSNR